MKRHRDGAEPEKTENVQIRICASCPSEEYNRVEAICSELQIERPLVEREILWKIRMAKVGSESGRIECCNPWIFCCSLMRRDSLRLLPPLADH